MPATEFERLGGRGSTRKWRQSLRYLGGAVQFDPIKLTLKPPGTKRLKI